MSRFDAPKSLEDDKGNRLTTELQASVDLLEAQIESAPDGILVVDDARHVVSLNQKLIELWGLPDEVVRSRSDERVVASMIDRLEDPVGFVARLEELHARPAQPSHDEIRLKDGRIFDRHSSSLSLAPGMAPARIFFFRDMTARRRAEDHIAKLAREDVLTGLMNRGAFLHALQKAIARVRRGARTFALLYLDLDHFKEVNDTLGHPVGDVLLRRVAERLRGAMRDVDFVARFGGDEFAVLQADVTEPAEVAALAERLVSALAAPFPIEDGEIRIAASVGVTLHDGGSASAEALLSQADLAMYRAKAEGRGTYRFFVEGMDAEVRTRTALASDLRQALTSEGQLSLAYQPQVDLASGRIVGVEALARWRHPKRGPISPSEFVPLAERSGLMVPLGRWVLRSACTQAKRWADQGIDFGTVAVNVSGAQFRTPAELEAAVRATLDETGLPAHFLEIEVTEGVLMEGWFEQRDVLSRMTQEGVTFTVDDFGTGQSSLQHLARLPVGRLKVAQAFTCDMTRDPSCAALVKATIGLARDLGLRVIAEGVEKREQIELLTSWGCPDGQGFYFAKPLPADEVEPLLRRGVAVAGSGTRPLISRAVA
jgi:diguanylate cyclase (GGDEF)-like protein/PAS domain S-box-containing protein